MLDIKFIRDHPDLVREGVLKKGESDRVDDVLQLDARRREILQEGEVLKNRRNIVSEEVGMSVHPLSEGGRHFVDAVGVLNQAVAAVADNVLLVVAGRTIALGGA